MDIPRSLKAKATSSSVASVLLAVMGGDKDIVIGTLKLVILIHSPTIVNVLEMVGLSFRLLTCVKKMRNHLNPYW